MRKHIESSESARRELDLFDLSLDTLQSHKSFFRFQSYIVAAFGAGSTQYAQYHIQSHGNASSIAYHSPSFSISSTSPVPRRIENNAIAETVPCTFKSKYSNLYQSPSILSRAQKLQGRLSRPQSCCMSLPM